MWVCIKQDVNPVSLSHFSVDADGGQAAPSGVTASAAIVSLSPLAQASPLRSATGSGASPFSQASAQAAFSGSLDAARPSTLQSGQQSAVC